MDVSVELRVAPARQSAAFLDEQTKALRANLEQAQSRLSKFQQEKGIVVSDERLDQENARYNALVAQLAMAQAERVDDATRQRNTGTEISPDVLQQRRGAGAEGAARARRETKLTEISAIVGKNHPTRMQLEAQIGELKQQIAAETRRVSGGASTIEPRQLAEDRRAAGAGRRSRRSSVLSMRSDRDQIAVYLRDVDTAQRAYDAVTGARRPVQPREPEQPGQHAPAEPGGRAAGAVAAEGQLTASSASLLGGAGRRHRWPRSASRCSTAACAIRKT